jgi:2-polyprenyl-3-methyl-5-hydroxy-6-metoxy-1,4-benzoquinol methylase
MSIHAVVRECGDEDVVAGRGPGQIGWYRWAATLIAGQSVLDAGCGLGYGLDIMAASAASVRGQDLDERLHSDRVHVGPLSDLPSKSVDTVVSIDVVEHIEDDHGFVRELARIARRQLILTTPNWTAGRCSWPYHVREYTPRQLRALCATVGQVQVWKGTPDGSAQWPITLPALNDAFNDARVARLTAVPAMLLNRVVPTGAKIHSHLAAVVTLGHGAPQ